MLKVFVVEDEAPARRRLCRLVAGAGAEVVGEAGSMAEALSGLPERNADVALLDVELGDGTAFELLERLGGALDCTLIFTTAYDAHALRAFELEALDYLLKPIDPDRLRRALSRVKPRGAYAKRLLVEHRRALRFLLVEKIDWIEADRNYVLLHAGNEEFTLRATLESMERKLDPSRFARANRGAILNVDALDRLEKTESADLVAVLRSGARIVCSRKYWSQALERLL
jgi:two-component system, LytTR family, response regulator